ncbi:alpha/beta fold hydrolase [Phenylobacterium sp.]|uniref:esterase/lipase family protein n=1 Tax=Phenylobacterium sp. TaxID=1871053 RepID=UPI00301BD92B
MIEPAPRHGLREVRPGSDSHAVVVLHGIRQTAQDVRPFAEMMSDRLHGPRILVYGYDHTHALVRNGRVLHERLERELPKGRIDLVGYSMGGLVARLAASEDAASRIHTVVTLATPNRGSLSNTELTALGQIGRQAFETLLSPLIPRSEGVKDLTKAREIMRRRRKRLMNGDRAFTLDGDKRRYVSIPALWYSEDKAVFQFGPSLTMSGLMAAFKLAALKVKLEAMKKSHDGIVTENSNNLTLADGNDWAEFHLTKPGASKAPPLCHAVIDDCDQHDHMSVLREEAVAELVCALIDTADWRNLKTDRPGLVNARLHPFDI